MTLLRPQGAGTSAGCSALAKAAKALISGPSSFRTTQGSTSRSQTSSMWGTCMEMSPQAGKSFFRDTRIVFFLLNFFYCTCILRQSIFLMYVSQGQWRRYRNVRDTLVSIVGCLSSGSIVKEAVAQPMLHQEISTAVASTDF